MTLRFAVRPDLRISVWRTLLWLARKKECDGRDETEDLRRRVEGKWDWARRICETKYSPDREHKQHGRQGEQRGPRHLRQWRQGQQGETGDLDEKQGEEKKQDQPYGHGRVDAE